MANKWSYEDAKKRILGAKRKAEADMWAIIGDDPETENNPYQAESDLQQSNTVYARLYDGLEKITVRYDPVSDPRLRQWGSAVTVEYDGEYWITGPYKRRLTAQMDGLDMPTAGLPLREHDHTSTDEGGTLGADTVSATQIVAGSITGTEIASATIQNANMAANSIDSDQYVDGSINNAHLANDSVKVANLNNLSTSTNGYVRQISNDTFYSEKYNSTNTAPTASNDVTQGYTLFSKWFDILNLRKWIAFDVSTAAAVWKRYLFSGDVVPTDVDTLDGASTAFVVQTASDTFSSIDYSVSDSVMFYDGSTIRQPVCDLKIDTSGNSSTSGTAEKNILINAIPDSTMSNTSKLKITLTLEMEFDASSAGDRYRISLYWYDGSVYNAYPYSYFIQAQASFFAVMTFTWIVDQSALSPAVGATGAGNYAWRTTIQRTSGSGTVNLKFNSTNPTQQIVQEV